MEKVKIKDFHDWCSNKNLDLSFLNVKTEGSAKRAGVRPHAYPAGYVRQQYADADFVATAADAAYYLGQMSPEELEGRKNKSLKD